MRNSLAVILIAVVATNCVTRVVPAPLVDTDLGRSLNELLTRVRDFTA